MTTKHRHQKRNYTFAATVATLGALVLVVGAAIPSAASSAVASSVKQGKQVIAVANTNDDISVRTVMAHSGTTPARAGEGVIRIVNRMCRNSAGWRRVAAANNITPPVYRVLLNQPVHVVCGQSDAGLPVIQTVGSPPAMPHQNTTKPAASTSVPTGAWARPLTGHCVSYDNYGVWRTWPWPHTHGGTDMGAATGTPIHAIHAGTAHWGYEAKGAGIYVWVDHGNGTSSWYFHMSRRGVPDGSHVSAGQVIGYVGMTGDATGPHLHLEVHIGGSTTDSVTFLANRNVHLRC